MKRGHLDGDSNGERGKSCNYLRERTFLGEWKEHAKGLRQDCAWHVL